MSGTGDSPGGDDPRDLARRLAEEAKARQLAKRLAEEAKARTARPAPPAPAPAPVDEKRSLADRAARPQSTEDALRKAIADEAAADATRKAKPAPRVAPKPEPAIAAAPVVAPAAPAVPVARPADVQPAPLPVDPATLLAERLPGARVELVRSVDNRVVFQALWQAHRARALAEGDATLIVAADVLVDAALRIGTGHLIAARVVWRDVPRAAWLDTERRVLLAIAPMPDVYLAGV